MDLSKSYEFFKPSDVGARVHIIGCGAVGSTVAELLVRSGVDNITLYDYDRVEAHNIANQMYRAADIGKLKVEALRDLLLEINPDLHGIRIENQGYQGQRLSGYVFLCLDNIDKRRVIVGKNAQNHYIKAMFDIRIRLVDGQHYAADWSDREMIQNLIASMQFSHEEAEVETPMTACNLAMSVAPTVRDICTKAVANFMNYVKGGGLKKMILTDSFDFDLQAY